MNRQHQALPNPKQTKQIFAEYPAHLHINLLPNYQGQGIGSRLMRKFEAHMLEQEVRGIHLTTSNKNHKALPFYKKMGFEKILQSEIFHHPHFDGLRFPMFTKKLTKSA